MSRIRTIKPELWTSEQIISCSIEARLLFIGLWNFCDDAGIHPASFIRLKAEVFPIENFTQDDIKRWIGELITNGLLREYAVGDKTYWLVTGWKQHQKIDKPTYRHPLPQSEFKMLPDNSTTAPRKLADDSAPIRQSIIDQSPTPRRIGDDSSVTEWNEMEDKGKKKEICEVETSQLFVSVKNSIANTQTQFSQVDEVFNYWQTTMNHPKSKLDSKRSSKIKQALKLGYSVDELKKAILGCSNSSFHMGANDQKQKYNDLTLILRDAEHIEKFIDIHSSNPNSLLDGSNNVFAGAI